MNVRVYTLSAIAVTLSAAAGLWFGAVLATTDFDAERAGSDPAPEAAVVSGARGPTP
ncbi:hypothetical protein [Actinopolyspora mortivallis]|uniref:hypothetical protein n=1 Tax=Actinopolyspora mortivallis TaxID=33906 RepID=UPI0015E5CB4C|nr:hypothetical protein [Actinopolyspora mortivallis]